MFAPPSSMNRVNWMTGPGKNADEASKWAEIKKLKADPLIGKDYVELLDSEGSFQAALFELPISMHSSRERLERSRGCGSSVPRFSILGFSTFGCAGGVFGIYSG